MRSGRRRTLNRALIALLVVMAAYALVMIWVHPRFIYPFFDDVFAADGFEAHFVPVSGAEPVEVHIHEAAEGAPVVLYFMGNVGTLALFQPMPEHHVTAGRSVVGMTYRGGGGVPGSPSETVLKRDALAVADYVKDRFEGAPLIVQGYSLGTGLAVHVAARRAVEGLILSAPYDALCRLMARRSRLPACYLPVQKWRSDRDAAAIRAPVLVLHGTGDRIVPYVNGARLAGVMEDADVPLQFEAIQGARHTNLLSFPGYLAQIDAFIAARR